MPDPRSPTSGGADPSHATAPDSGDSRPPDSSGNAGTGETGSGHTDGDGNEEKKGEREGSGGGRGRSVVVPDRVYKTVTVFSTLFAVVTVVGGFVVLDGATNRARAPLSEIDPLLALVGIALVLAGAVTYAFSTRFEAAGMGNAKDDTDEPSDNG